jgi:two-component system KDP operon response regulator KdpE
MLNSRTSELDHRPFALIVDDDPETLLLIGEMLEYGGYGSAKASDFDAAIVTLAQGPAVVLLDLVMPGRVPERLLDYLAQQAHDVPVVLMSGVRREELRVRREQARARGVQVAGILTKPLWLDDVLRALADALPGPSPNVALAEHG